MPAPAWVFFNADSEPLGDPALAVFQCGHGRIQRHGQQDAQQYINAAVLLEQDRGRNDGNAEHGGGGSPSGGRALQKCGCGSRPSSG